MFWTMGAAGGGGGGGGGGEEHVRTDLRACLSPEELMAGAALFAHASYLHTVSGAFEYEWNCMQADDLRCVFTAGDARPELPVVLDDERGWRWRRRWWWW